MADDILPENEAAREAAKIAEKKAQQKKASATYYLKNKHAMNAKRMAHAKAKPELHKAAAKRSYDNNVDKNRAASISRYWANRDKCLARDKKRAAEKRVADPEWAMRELSRLREWIAKQDPILLRQKNALRQKERRLAVPLTEVQKVAQSIYVREWKARNPDKVRDYNRRGAAIWIARHPSRLKELRRRRRLTNPERVRAKDREYAHRRRARTKGPGCSLEDIRRILHLQMFKCAYCRKSLRKGFEIDHIHPLSRNGAHDPRNIQLTCSNCNRKKHNKLPHEFARLIGKLI